MEELEIQLQDGQTLAIMFKDLTWQARGDLRKRVHDLTPLVRRIC